MNRTRTGQWSLTVSYEERDPIKTWEDSGRKTPAPRSALKSDSLQLLFAGLRLRRHIALARVDVVSHSLVVLVDHP
jgi:hypothetical protein